MRGFLTWILPSERFRREGSRLRWSIIGILVLIAGMGFAMLYSAAGGRFNPWATRQMLHFAFGMLMLFMIALSRMQFWYRTAYAWYGLSFLLLVSVSFLGFKGKGGQRWVDLYFFNIQPSELMKIALILALGRYLHDRGREKILQTKTMIVPILLILMPALFVLRQPDLGTSVLLVCAGVSLLFAAGVQWWKFMAVGGSGLASLPLLWSMLHDYQKKRVLTFFNPEHDPLGSGYHILQSKIALGSGGFWGYGFVKGSQSHLNFLPEKQTDFIFAMFGEEFGMIGGLILLFLYSIVLMFGYTTALNARSLFSKLMAIGLTTIFFLYVFINIAMVMGLIPVVGVPLPLMSYGGTSLLTILIGQGLLLALDRQRNARFLV